MIELFHALAPNGWKITIALEECGLPYRITPVILKDGGQHAPDFLKISPNGRIPAIVDHDPSGGGPPIALFESAAILLHLAEKSGQLLPAGQAARADAVAWLIWQVAHLGPTLGQHGHFLFYAPEHQPYALDRFRQEALRLYGVLDRRLRDTGAYVSGEAYGVADIACFPWVMTHKAQRFTLDEFPHVKRWFATVRARDAVQRGIAAGRDLFPTDSRMGGEARRAVHGFPATEKEGG